MEIPKINIPDIKILKINIPQHNAYQVLSVPLPSLKMPGCVKYHRDASPKNTALYDDDPNGTVISCPYGSMPTFQPMLYDRRRIQIVETKQEQIKAVEQEQPKVTPKKPKLPEEKKEDFFIKCPGDKDLRVGMYASEDRLEKVVGHKLSDDGKTCITLFEDSKFIDRWMPSPPLIVSTSFIAICAAASPILLNLIKGAIKNLIKKVTAGKSKSADEVKSDPS